MLTSTHYPTHNSTFTDQMRSDTKRRVLLALGGAITISLMLVTGINSPARRRLADLPKEPTLPKLKCTKCGVEPTEEKKDRKTDRTKCTSATCTGRFELPITEEQKTEFWELFEKFWKSHFAAGMSFVINFCENGMSALGNDAGKTKTNPSPLSQKPYKFWVENKEIMKKEFARLIKDFPENFSTGLPFIIDYCKPEQPWKCVQCKNKDSSEGCPECEGTGEKRLEGEKLKGKELNRDQLKKLESWMLDGKDTWKLLPRGDLALPKRKKEVPEELTWHLDMKTNGQIEGLTKEQQEAIVAHGVMKVKSQVEYLIAKNLKEQDNPKKTNAKNKAQFDKYCHEIMAANRLSDLEDKQYCSEMPISYRMALQMLINTTTCDSVDRAFRIFKNKIKESLTKKLNEALEVVRGIKETVPTAFLEETIKNLNLDRAVVAA